MYGMLEFYGWNAVMKYLLHKICNKTYFWAEKFSDAIDRKTTTCFFSYSTTFFEFNGEHSDKIDGQKFG